MVGYSLVGDGHCCLQGLLVIKCIHQCVWYTRQGFAIFIILFCFQVSVCLLHIVIRLPGTRAPGPPLHDLRCEPHTKNSNSTRRYEIDKYRVYMQTQCPRRAILEQMIQAGSTNCPEGSAVKMVKSLFYSSGSLSCCNQIFGGKPEVDFCFSTVPNFQHPCRPTDTHCLAQIEDGVTGVVCIPPPPPGGALIVECEEHTTCYQLALQHPTTLPRELLKRCEKYRLTTTEATTVTPVTTSPQMTSTLSDSDIDRHTKFMNVNNLEKKTKVAYKKKMKYI